METLSNPGGICFLEEFYKHKIFLQNKNNNPKWFGINKNSLGFLEAILYASKLQNWQEPILFILLFIITDNIDI